MSVAQQFFGIGSEQALKAIFGSDKDDLGAPVLFSRDIELPETNHAVKGLLM